MAYRNRYDEYLRKRQGVLPDAKQWKAADYARISREDGDKEESDSIGTQFDIIDDYIAHTMISPLLIATLMMVGAELNFDRPDFMRLMEDIKKGKINCVIVKDLSRLGRNYILVGQYLEMIFPMLNIRFISVNDRIDSIKDPASINNALVSFKNVMNDEYCRDISNKVRSSLDRKRSKGEFIGSFASYGYMKDPDDHHHLIVDPVAAEVVKNIFDWFLQGMSIIGIAKRLNHMGIPNPSAYKRQCGLNYKHPAGQLDSAWPDSSVKRVLKNRLYVGDMVQNKNRTKSYKVQVSVAVPEENWVIVPNMHEAIIDREKFETVQQLLMRDTRTSPGINHVSIFAGYIRCADCLRAMGKKSVAQSYGKYHYYVCQTFRKAGRNLCTKHTIREKQLYDAVLATIQSQIDLAVSMDQLVNDLKSQNVRAAKSSRLEKMLQLKEEEYEKVSRCRIDLYPDWKAGILSKDEYLSLKAKIGEQLEQIEIAIANIKEEISKYQSAPVSENKFISSFLRYRNIQVLTREVIVELIEMIYVHEGGTITIQFKYQDEYQRLLDLIDEQGLASAAG